jgi:hypothetical protein
LDRLLLLLDTGSSSSVRNTAAKQLAHLAVKSVATDVVCEEDVKWNRQHVSRADPSAWAELMAVVARVSPLCHSQPVLIVFADYSLFTFQVVRNTFCGIYDAFPHIYPGPFMATVTNI